MRKPPVSTPSIIKEDSEVKGLEDRKANAEREFLVICDDKKRVLGEAEKIEASIATGKDTIKKNNAEIVKTNQLILDAKADLRTVTQDLDSFIKQSNLTQKNIELDIASIAKDKAAKASEITALVKKLEATKEDQAKEVKSFEAKKEALETEVTNLGTKKAGILASIKTEETKLLNLKNEIKALEGQKPALEKSITTYKNTIEDQVGAIENNKVILDQQEADKKDKETELLAFDGKIAKKKAELNELEQRAFTIVGREDSLVQREEFIKEKYERAGVKYEE